MSLRSVGAVIGIAMGVAAGSSAAAPPPDADAVLARARAALGGADKLASVSGLSVSAQSRSIETGATGVDLELSFVPPDRYHKVETRRLGAIDGVIRTSVLSGPAATSRVTGRGGATIKQTPMTPERARKLAAGLGHEQVRLLAALLLRTDGLEVKYLGEAEASDGRADVLELCSGGEGCFRLFFDKESRLPLMLSYQGNAPVLKSGGEAKGAGTARRKGDGKPSRVDASPGATSEITIHLGSYRAEGGILFPHEVSFAADGAAFEEWRELRFQPNPGFKPEHFRVSDAVPEK